MKKSSSSRSVCVLLATLLVALFSVVSVSAQTHIGDVATQLVWIDGNENNWIFQQYIAVDSTRHRLYQVGLADCTEGVSECSYGSYARLAVIDTLSNSLLTKWPIDSFPEGYDFHANTPQAIGVNPVTNKIYVTLSNGPGSGDWVLAIIDGATGSNRMLALPQQPNQTAIAINPITNMIYISANHWILAVNGNNDSISIITVPEAPYRFGGMAINTKTNKLYLTEGSGNNSAWVAVVNLETNNVSFLSLPNYSGSFSFNTALAVNEDRNEVYFPGGNAVAILDANSNTFTYAPVPNVVDLGNNPSQGLNIPFVNSATNRVYFGSAAFYVMNAVTRQIAYLPSDPSLTSRLSAAYDAALNRMYSIVGPDPGKQRPNWSVAAIDLGSTSTPTGANVMVEADLLSLTFDTVTLGGVTSVTPIDPATAGQIPGGFAVSDSVAYEISTTAGYTGPVTIAFTVPEPITEADFNSLSILHNENGTLVDVTATTPARVYATRTIYATTSSFSPFYLARKAAHVKTLFDQTKAYKTGSTIPVKLQVMSASNTNLSSSNAPLVVRDIRFVSGNTLASVADAGNANPDYNFRYDPTLGGAGGGYIFNLSTKGLTAGQYVLSFYAGNDRSFFYTVRFEVK